MKVLFLGEIVGKAGLAAAKHLLKPFARERGVDLVVANAEGATSGYGLGVQHAMTLFKYGIDILTGGEKLFFKLDMQEFVTRKDRVLRPANYPEEAPGRGVKHLEVAGHSVCVVNLLGQAAMGGTHLGNPFILANRIVDKARESSPFVLVVFHAAMTAEKEAMGHHLAGRASAVVGTHCKVMTADARVLDGGTAYISDCGRCGAFMSVGGFAPGPEVQKLSLATFRRSEECFDDVRLQGVLVEIGDDGRAAGIEVVDLKDPDAAPPAPKA